MKQLSLFADAWDRIVYFVADSRGYVKVGFTTAGALKRKRQLDNGPIPLSLLGCIPVAESESDHRYHRQFWAFHVRREWFRADPSFIESITELMQSRGVVKDPEALARLSPRAVDDVDQITEAFNAHDWSGMYANLDDEIDDAEAVAIIRDRVSEAVGPLMARLLIIEGKTIGLEVRANAIDAIAHAYA